jgi:hypothetical protein
MAPVASVLLVIFNVISAKVYDYTFDYTVESFHDKIMAPVASVLLVIFNAISAKVYEN